MAFIVTQPRSLWTSAQSIGQALALVHQDEVIETLGGDTESARALGTKIFHDQPDQVVFIAQGSPPLPLIKALSDIYQDQKRPALHFHLYGDFQLQAPLWKLSEDTLKKFSCLFFAASSKQRDLLASFVNSPEYRLALCPFPVDTQTFHEDRSLRIHWRQRLELDDQDFALIYSGRLSLQKNVDLLVNEFGRIKKKTALPLKIFFAGSFDDMGSPLFEREEPLGASFQRFQKTLAALPSEIQNSIHWLGELSKKELAGLYNAADGWISLSLHHDEDFGLAPAEALCCGCPTVLTGWGGFHDFSFSERALDCQLIPVSLSENKGHVIDTGVIERAVLQLTLGSSPDFSARTLRAQQFQGRFSVAAVKKHIEKYKVLKPPVFNGWTELFNELSERMKNKIPFPEGPKKHSLYGKIYSNYI